MEHKCIHCLEMIADGARRCRHCRSWQSHWFADHAAPRLQKVALLVALPLVIVLVAFAIYTIREVSSRAVPGGRDFQALKIRNSTFISFSHGEQRYIGVIGHLENPTDDAWSGLYLHVDFFNSAGELIDTIADRNYDLLVGPKSATSFRISGLAARADEEYSSHHVEIRWGHKR